MIYVVLIAMGILIDRYVLPIFDALLEMIVAVFTNKTVDTSISIQRKQVEFQQDKECDDGHRIGFEYPTKDRYDEDCDDCEDRK